MARTAWKQAVLGSISVLVYVLAARMIVLVAVSGSIALTWAALQNPDLMRLGALGIYAIAIVCPLVWLASRR